MAEGARLESVYTRKRIEGSNPSLPAIFYKKAPNENSGLFYIQNLSWGMILGLTLLRQAENR